LRDPLVTTTEEIIVLSFSQQQIAHFRALASSSCPAYSTTARR